MKAWKAAAIGFGMVFTAAASHSSTALPVVVFDYAGSPSDLLLSAMKAGRYAFHRAGIETEWTLCHPVRGCPVPDRYAQVKILARPLPGMLVSPSGLAATITCVQNERCAASYIFFDRAFDFAQGQGVPLDLTLGYVMAHEIGHLMGLGHRPGGIMTAAFNAHDLERAALGQLCFCPAEARELRTAIQRSRMASNPTERVRQTGIHTGVAE
ncbi:MAG TPA: matrixin family metalloprotease [Bryobacteraceae bacterium]|nr:matrixin family metalloprotease [Bryobacteraceae bacterium]